jgi:hypothetical protein
MYIKIQLASSDSNKVDVIVKCISLTNHLYNHSVQV